MTILKNILFLFSTFLIGCNNPIQKKVATKKPAINIESTRTKARQAFVFCKAQNFNIDFCILNVNYFSFENENSKQNKSGIYGPRDTERVREISATKRGLGLIKQAIYIFLDLFFDRR